MPLIIAVLAIIVVFSWAGNHSKEAERKNKQYTAAIRRTNARQERLQVDKYMKHGKCFDEAFELARSDMLEDGFEPCIPKDAYKPRLWSEIDGDPPETSACPKCEDYDSDAVKHLRNDYRTMCSKRKVPYHRDEEDAYVYSERFPANVTQYTNYLTARQHASIYDAVDVGRYISYLGLGTCEVVDLDFSTSSHVVKVVTTGEIRKIRFGDKKITRL